MRSLPSTALPVLLALAACGAPSAERANPAPAEACPHEGRPLDGEARLYIEHNATDQDTGVHGALGQEGLATACVRTPDGTQILLVDPVGRLGELGINQFFFESREPPADEYPTEQLRREFPEGEYAIAGIDHAGIPRIGSARFTHDIPAAPVVTSPELAEEEVAGDVVVPATGLVVRWEPVSGTLDGGPVTVAGYEVIVTRATEADPDALSLPVYDVHVPPDTTELPVADGFLRPGTAYELEVLAIEASGNQTISVGFFTTAG